MSRYLFVLTAVLLVGPSARAAGDLDDLRELDLGFTGVGDDGMKSLAGLKSLRVLNLDARR